MTDAAEILQSRLRDDLRAAMRAKAAREVAVLRGLIAAIDNAAAVPLGDGHRPYAPSLFGDGAAEVPRLHLDGDAIAALLAREIAEKTDAAAQLAALGRIEEAAELQSQAEIAARYRLTAPASGDSAIDSQP